MDRNVSRRGVLRAGCVCAAPLLVGCGGGGDDGGDGDSDGDSDGDGGETPGGTETSTLGSIEEMRIGLPLPNRTGSRYGRMASSFELFRTGDAGDGDGGS